jgi:hypothetical protein
MTRGTVITIGVTVGAVMAHFIYQALFGYYDWNLAIHRSYFSFIAALSVWIFVRGEFRQDR